MNLLAGKPADRVPVAFFHHFCPPNERGKGLENQETFERSVIGRKLARKKFGPDAIKIMNGTLMMIPADGSFEKNSKRFAQCNTPAVDSAFAKNSGAGQRVRDFYEDSGAPCICHQLLSVPDAAAFCAHAYRAGRMRAVLGPAVCMDKWKTAARGRGKAHTRRTLKALALRKRVSCKSTCRPGALCLPKRACFWRRKEVKCSYIGCRMQRREERGPFPFSGKAGETACFTQGAGAENL